MESISFYLNPGVVESKEAGNCADGIDNDCDGQVDEDESGCFMITVM